MDEIDGICGTADMGGLKAICDVIKETRVPIICVCNDRNSQKIKTLATYCLDLRFEKPSLRNVADRMKSIIEKEGQFLSEDAILEVVKNAEGDIRQSLTNIEFMIKCGNNDPSCIFMKDGQLTTSPGEACKKLLNSNEAKLLNFRQKLDLFFIDNEIVPFFMHVVC